MASFFGVSLFYLRGETNDRTQMENWLNSSFTDETPAVPVVKRPAAPRTGAQSSSGGEESPVVGAFLKSKAFQDMVRSTVADFLRSSEGQELLAKAVRRELSHR